MLLTIFKKSFILPVWLGYEYGYKRNIANVKTTITFESHISFGFWGFKASGIFSSWRNDGVIVKFQEARTN